MIQTQHSELESSPAEACRNPASATPAAGRSLPEVCDELRCKVTDFLEEKTEDKILRNVQGQVRISMGVIEEALSRYEPEQLSLSYNGGKDCLVLLVLLLACLPVWAKSKVSRRTNSTNADASSTNQVLNHSTQTDSAKASRLHDRFPKTLQAVYIVSPDPFPEVEEFVNRTARQYHLDLAQSLLPMKAALEEYLGKKESVRAVFVGTRRTDPHGQSLTHFDPTDVDWPQFMRIHPVIDWHYAEVWAFIRHLDIPFCELYSRGFTSLGGTSDTHPNPALALDKSRTKFRPAYELMDDDEERLGRDR